MTFIIKKKKKTISWVLITLMTFIGVDYPSNHTIELYSESISMPIVTTFICGKIFPPIFVNESTN